MATIFSLLLEILIGLLNPFGWLGEHWISWNPLFGSIHIPKRVIISQANNIQVGIFKINTIEFNKITLIVSVIQSISIQVIFDSINIETLLNSYSYKDAKSKNNSNKSIDKPNNLKLLQTILSYLYFTLNINITFVNTQLKIIYNDEVNSLHIIDMLELITIIKSNHQDMKIIMSNYKNLLYDNEKAINMLNLSYHSTNITFKNFQSLILDFVIEDLELCYDHLSYLNLLFVIFTTICNSRISNDDLCQLRSNRLNELIDNLNCINIADNSNNDFNISKSTPSNYDCNFILEIKLNILIRSISLNIYDQSTMVSFISLHNIISDNAISLSNDQLNSVSSNISIRGITSYRKTTTGLVENLSVLQLKSLRNQSSGWVNIYINSNNDNSVTITSKVISTAIDINTIYLSNILFFINELTSRLRCNSLIYREIRSNDNFSKFPSNIDRSNSFIIIANIKIECPDISILLIDNIFNYVQSQPIQINLFNISYNLIDYKSQKLVLYDKLFDNRVISKHSNLYLQSIKLSTNSNSSGICLNEIALSSILYQSSEKYDSMIEKIKTDLINLSTYQSTYYKNYLDDVIQNKNIYKINTSCHISNIVIELSHVDLKSIGYSVGLITNSISKPNWTFGLVSNIQKINLSISPNELAVTVDQIKCNIIDEQSNIFVQLLNGIKYTSYNLSNGILNKSNLYLFDDSLDIIALISSKLSLLKVQIGKNTNCLLSTLTTPSSINLTHDLSNGIGYTTNHLHLIINKIAIHYDNHLLYPLIQAIAILSSSIDIGKRINQTTNGYKYNNVITARGKFIYNFQPLQKRCLSNPSNIMLVRVNEIYGLFTYQFQDVITLSLNSLEYSNINFNKQVTQQSVYFSNLNIADLTLPNAIHKRIIGNSNDTENQTNLVELHITHCLGNPSLFEIRGERLQIYYIQRSTMTLVNYIRDFVISGIRESFHLGRFKVIQSIVDRIKTYICIDDNLDLYTYIDNDIDRLVYNVYSITFISNPAIKGYNKNGFFRLCVSVRHCEVHLPCNSCSNEAIVILVSHVVFYKSCPVVDKIASTYSKGIYLNSRNWICEGSNIRYLFDQLFNVDDNKYNNLSNTVYWNINTNEVLHWLVTPNQFPIGVSTSNFDIKLINVIICTWCNQNAIGENLMIDGVLNIHPNMLGSSTGLDKYVEDDGTQYTHACDELRNKILVDISSNYITWLMSQGQYQAIIYLIQQNFSEPMCVVPEIYPAPKSRTIDLTETVYGKYSMNLDLPVFSTVPIHIKSGRILALENTNDYYENLQNDLSVIQDSASYLELMSEFIKPNILASTSVPNYSYHYKYSYNLFSSLYLPTLSRYSIKYVINKPANHFKFNPLLGSTFISVNFEYLEIDFYRRHYGGGNGIEVSALTFVLVNHMNINPNQYQSLDQITSDVIVFAPISFNQLNKHNHSILSNSDLINNNNIKISQRHHRKSIDIDFNIDNNIDSDFDSHKSSDRQSDISIHSLSSIDDNFISMETMSNLSVPLPHIRYSQQGIGNLRRCIVTISDSIFIIQLIPILTSLKYFTESLQLQHHRHLLRLTETFDYKVNLDVEVLCNKTIFCLPNLSNRNDMNVSTNLKVADDDILSGWCIYNNFSYTHCWRGFLISGPGRSIIDLSLDVISVFIAPLHEIQVVDAQSVIDACLISVKLDQIVLPIKNNSKQNIDLLKPFMSFGSWVNQNNRLGNQSGLALRTITANISPNNTLSNQTSYNNINRNRSSHIITNNNIQITLSLKDIIFLTLAIKKLVTLFKKRMRRLELNESFPILWLNSNDLNHLFLPTFYNPYVLYQPWNERDNDVIANICNLSVLLRNNTYNIRICQVDLLDIQVSFNKSGNNLHAAIGLTLQASYYNDLVDAWEPIIESVQMTSIAASDSTKIIGSTDAENAIVELSENKLDNENKLEEFEEDFPNDEELDLSNHSNNPTKMKIKVDVYSYPVEINISQYTLVSLVKRLRLADVVTTSSPHLPPYLIINELGVSVKCNIGIGSQIITSEKISIGASFPIEIHHLSKSSNSIKKDRLNAVDNSDDKEHLLHLSFAMNDEIYESVKPLPIDREGISSFDIRLKQFNKIQSINSSTSLSSLPKSTEDTPFVLLSMRIKEDGGREIIIRSMLSFKNQTSRLLYLSLRRNSVNIEVSILPGNEWYVPIYLAHPRTSLHLRFDKNSEWFEALPVLISLMLQGQWGLPSKLRSELVSCPPEVDTIDGKRTSWILLLRPDVKESRGGTYISVKYPSKDPHRPPPMPISGVGALESSEIAGVDGLVGLDDIYQKSVATASATSVAASYLLSQATNSLFRNINSIQPMCINFLAPLQLCNIIPQPLLYRIADADGLITSEGILLPGEIVDIHNLYQLFASKIYISIRMINYIWSKWTKLFTRTNPYTSNEKIIDISMTSMNLIYNQKDLILPTVDLQLSMKEHFIRISIPYVIFNRTGYHLEYCESKNTDSYIPQISETSADRLININPKNYLDNDKYLYHKSNLSLTINSFDDSEINTSLIDSPNSKIYQSNKMTTSKKQQINNKTVNLLVHLPHDHLRIVEITSPIELTLRDVYYKIMSNNQSKIEQEHCYIFFYWDNGKLGSMKLDNVIIDNDNDIGNSNLEGSINNSEGGFASNKSNNYLLSYTSSTSVEKDKSSTIPTQMKFDMLVDCSGQILTMDTKVESLIKYRLRLCHLYEYNIYKQINSIKVNTYVKDKQMFTMFNKVKYIYRTMYYPFEGEGLPIPFHQKIIGFSNLLSIRYVDKQGSTYVYSEWSDGIDLQRIDLSNASIDIPVPILSTNENILNQTPKSKNLEFSILLDKGKGFYQNITSISLVPKFIIVSKLFEPIEIRQVDVSTESTYLKLYPGAITSFHHPFKDKVKLLEIRRLLNKSLFTKTLSQTADNDKVNLWSGEIDICNLGIVYCKLRSPIKIVKIDIEMIGASFVATFSEHSLKWPPYRIDNQTNYDVRVKQLLNNEKNSSISAFERLASFINNNNTVSLQNQLEKANEFIDWEYIPGNSSISYTWDYPKSGLNYVELEFLQKSPTNDNSNNTSANSSYNKININLNVINKLKTIDLTNNLHLSNSLAEGLLYYRQSTDNTWNQVYCIIKESHIYIFNNDNHLLLNDIINLTSFDSNNNIQLASVFKYTEKSTWEDLYNSLSIPVSLFSTNAGQNSASNSNLSNIYKNSKISSKPLDINQIRIILLKLGEKLNLFTKYNLIHYIKSFDNDNESVNSETSHDLSNDNVLTDSEIENQSSLTESYLVTDSIITAIIDNVASISNKKNDMIPLSLRSLFIDGYKVDQLLDILSQYPLIVAYDVFIALTYILTVNEKISYRLFNMLLVHGYIELVSIDNDLNQSPNKAVDNLLNDSNTLIDSEDEIEEDVDEEDSIVLSTVTDSIQTVESLNKEESSKPVQNLSRPSIFDNTSSIENMRTVSPNTTRRKSMILNSMPKKKEIDIQQQIQILKEKYVKFKPPSINPELLAHSLSFDNSSNNSDKIKNETDSYDVLGFTVLLNDIKYHFKCSTMLEYFGWIQACRLGIELSWIEYMKFYPNTSNDTNININQYKTKIYLKVRSDGPSKVLEIYEPHSDKKKTNEIINQVNQSNISNSQDNYRITDALSVSIIAQSIGISLIDNEPSEVLHLSLQEIEISIERTRNLVRMGGTIQTILVSNQLLNPFYPVALFPRRNETDTDESKNVQRLLLPGLHQHGNHFPSLHLYFQERYHHDDDNTNMNLPDNYENNLIYFEIFTLWLSPMQLDLDEEIFIRLTRFVQVLRQTLQTSNIHSQNILQDNNIVTEKSWGIQNSLDIYNKYKQFVNQNQYEYSTYDINAKPTKGIYFSLLQLHPLDIVLHIHPSPEFALTTTEMALVSLLTQIDSSRICLNALITEHAYGSYTIILEIITKHYRAALWKQLHKLIGSTDLVDGSIGLVANLGTGVYDMFYEPIDGLIDDNNSNPNLTAPNSNNVSFFNGISKGGKVLATKAIGGTSAITSKITGGLGRGVALLTLDSSFQRNRYARRMNKSNSVSEGIVIGTKELGKNIVEGVTGIVISPYRGWEEGGGVGLGMGIAKGILGVAFKPAVGVFDLASRTTEGLRNIAYNAQTNDLFGHRKFRRRIPRSFGRYNIIQIYDIKAAAAQYITDKLLDFKRDLRINVIYHQHFLRKVIERSNEESLSSKSVLTESWGMSINKSYVCIVTFDRIGLIRLNSSSNDSNQIDASFIWSCPAICIEQLYSDKHGDLVITTNTPVSINTSNNKVISSSIWNNNNPNIYDKYTSDYFIFQLLLEKTIGRKRAREQPLQPHGGLINTNVFKKYSTGIRSLLLTPTKHTYQLYGCVLYEYTYKKSKIIDSSSNNDNYLAETINELFGCPVQSQLNQSYVGSNNTSDDTTDTDILPEGYISFIYPLVDVMIVGPYLEDNQHNKYSISISRRDGQRMKTLKKDDIDDLSYVEYPKNLLTLLFINKDIAVLWKEYLEKHVVTQPSDCINPIKRQTNYNDRDNIDSISNLLVIPSSGSENSLVESLKFEITRTLQSGRKD